MRILPKTLLIFGDVYRVIKIRIKGGIAGDCDSEKKIIKICPKQTQKQKLHTLLHEMNHAVIFRTGIFQAVDEKVIETISENIATAILENFKLRKK